MKRILGFVMLLFSLHFIALTANAEVQKKEPQDVKLEKGHSGNENAYPRSLLNIPIVCTYMDGVIQLSLLEEVGDWEVIVTNQLTSEEWSATNSLLLNVSTASGTYLVQIVTEDGTLYYGTYTL